jgi:predicted nucleic acid-binding Zn ribbon protein
MKKNFRKDEVHSVGSAIRDLLNSYSLSTKFDEAQLLNSWERMVGKPIAKRTKKLSIKNKVLFVEFDSPTIRNDFSMHKAQILNMFQQEFGAEFIAEIVVM